MVLSFSTRSTVDPDQPVLRRPPLVRRAVRPWRARRPGSVGARAGAPRPVQPPPPGRHDPRQYGLGGLLACAACGERLIGHVGRYRHQDACEAFRAAAPRRVQRDGATIDPRVRGESYKVGVYEEAIGLALGRVAVSARLQAAVVAEVVRPDAEGSDVLAQARLKRERERAALQFAKDRDLAALEATLARLDAEAEAARQRPSRTPTAAEARTWLVRMHRDCPPPGRHR